MASQERRLLQAVNYYVPRKVADVFTNAYSSKIKPLT